MSSLSIELFDYDLPEQLIAQTPAQKRHNSRLLAVHGKQNYSHLMFPDLLDFFEAGDVLVLNNTKVFPARLKTNKAHTHGKVELLFLAQMAQDKTTEKWQVMYKSSKSLKPGMTLNAANDHCFEVIEVKHGGIAVVAADFKVLPFLQQYGEVPLPPYIGRNPKKDDKKRYQTVYAKQTGAVAAPTAGLHFTEDILHQLKNKGVERTEITLHVGPGTFLPVREEAFQDIRQHQMHAEFFEVGEKSADQINNAKRKNHKIWAVGTTVVRTLESTCDDNGQIRACSGNTDIFITPGFRFKVVDRLLTNFHLPRSTLIMLVSAFAGLETTMAAYREAIEQKYRFYSYGDSSLWLPEAEQMVS